MSVTLRFCGAARTVTGSCHLFETPAGRLLVDCGLFQGPKTLKELNYGKFPFDPSGIDAVLLTHAHIDHSGLIPKLTSGGFRGPVFATHGTIDLCSFMLPDAGSIQESEVMTLNRRNAARGRPLVKPIYTQRDALAALDAFRSVEYETWVEVMPGVRARYWNAGHLLGSASIEIEFAGEGLSGKPLRVLASGDLGPDAKLLQPDPEAPTGLDYVICESTYGDEDRPPVTRESRRGHLAAEVRAAHAAGGALLIPAFAVERTQELLVDLIDLMERGDIPAAPIFLDSPLAIRATEVFRQHAESQEADIDVARLLARRICTAPRRWRRARRSPSSPASTSSSPPAACATPAVSAIISSAGSGTPKRPCCWSASRRKARSGVSSPMASKRCASRATKSRWRRASAGSTNIPAMPTGRNWRAGSPRAGRSSAAFFWCMAKSRRSPA